MTDGRRHTLDWEHLFFLAVMLAFLVWYLSDAAIASPTFSNLILIGPVGAVAFILLLYVAATEVMGSKAATAIVPAGQEAAPSAEPSRYRTSSLLTIVLLMSFFGLFVAAIPYVGFDVATFFFMIATLWLLGERRVLFTLSLAFGAAIGVSVAALTILTFPIPMGLARVLWRVL